MKKLFSVYVRNADCGPACYYRIVQYVEELDHSGRGIIHSAVSKKEFCANLNCTDERKKKLLQSILYLHIVIRRFWSLLLDLLIYRPKTVVIQREIMPHIMPPPFGILVRLIGKSADIIWDFDDDIFESREISHKEKKLLLNQSEKIIVVSSYLKQLLPVKYQPKVAVMPTTEKCFLKDSLEDMLNRRKATYPETVSLVWVGTSGNLKYLDLIMSELDAAAKQIHMVYQKSIKLMIVCNCDYPGRSRLNHLKTEYIPWSRKNAQECIRNAHIAIMPLENTRFARGKGGFKLVQCMASGIPVIASDVGYNRSIVEPKAGYLIQNSCRGAWQEAVCSLAGNMEQWEAYCKGAYARYKESFYFVDILKEWEKLLMDKDEK